MVCNSFLLDGTYNCYLKSINYILPDDGTVEVPKRVAVTNIMSIRAHTAVQAVCFLCK
jgi:hypothetical protein